ncbi:hypothetical protein QTO34_015924 [Cnephaeus nilssonii]|uniref:FHF complex subunit HOOK-interacting protein C-terminal domain-containing protein n=1 Tax=Cnephaeus nilssonii TaxID=3371016 RepID=A0AA40I551_CNENI|nr:hypothetical protein QTO34_015924 [Eptesicus nilssonii]
MLGSCSPASSSLSPLLVSVGCVHLVSFPNSPVGTAEAVGLQCQEDAHLCSCCRWSQVTVEEVMTTTAYLDLFLRSISEPALLEIFLRFILLHRHENVHILDTLTSRINTPFRLCVVSLALFRTLIGLHCEDVMLQLVLRYLIPCNHMMLSQRWAVKERDCYSVSAAKLLALTPVCCSSGITLTLGNQERDYILWSKCTHDSSGPPEQPLPEASSPSACIVEYGKALDISYLQYLWEAHANILHCMRDCRVWSALYDGDSPDPDAFLQGLTEESTTGPPAPPVRLPQQLPRETGPQLLPRKDRGPTELEWDDSYDTGISSGADLENPGPPAPIDPPKHIQEMKKNAILRFKGSYIEESDFQDDVMVYRLCAEKDAEDTRKSQEEPARPPAQGQAEGQSPPTDNGPLPSPQPETDSEEEHHREDADAVPNVSAEPPPEEGPQVAPESNAESAPPVSEAEHGADPTAIDPEEEREGKEESKGEQEQEEGRKDLEEEEEEEDDFDSLMVEAPAEETVPSPFGVREEADCASCRPVRTQSAPFTGPFISVVLSKLENMLENSLHVNLLLIGIITQLASYPQPLLRSFLLNTNMVFQPSVRSLYQVLASVKNKIEQFASMERDFPGLLIQAQQYLLFRVDMSDVTAESLPKAPVGQIGRPVVLQAIPVAWIPLRMLPGRELAGAFWMVPTGAPALPDKQSHGGGGAAKPAPAECKSHKLAAPWAGFLCSVLPPQILRLLFSHPFESTLLAA